MRKVNKYFGIFESRESIISNLSNGNPDEWLKANPLFPEEHEILFAAYYYEDYSGDAQMFFVRDGVMYEYVGGHCSCNGLEDDRFSPGVVTVEALAMRENPLIGYMEIPKDDIERIKKMIFNWKN